MAPAVSLKENVVVKDGVAFFKNLSAGAVAATVAKTVIAPVERVKLILQLQNAQSTIAVDKRYTGMIDCFVRLPKEQGFLSFWRGNVANIYRSMAQESLGLAFKELFRHHLVGDPSNRTRYLLSNLTCGAAAGVATIAIIYPLDFTRTRLAIDMGRKKKDREFRGIVDCVLKIGRADGIRGLYKGLVPSLQYYVIYRGFYYGLFDIEWGQNGSFCEPAREPSLFEPSRLSNRERVRLEPRAAVKKKRLTARAASRSQKETAHGSSREPQSKRNGSRLEQ